MTPAEAADLTLGERVTFTETLKRRYRPAAPRSRRVWESSRLWEIATSRGPASGVVVGLRCLSDGECDDGYYDTPTVYHPTRTFPAVLVAYDRRRRPVLVLPEHLEVPA